MKSLVIDSSSAILLFKSGLFSAVVTCYNVFMPETVFNELIVHGHSGWEDFMAVHRQKLIRVIRDIGESDESPESAELNRMGTGERDAITLFRLVRADFILIDDGRGARFCRRKNIPFVNGLLMAKILRLSGCIQREPFEEAFGLLRRIGRYSADVLAYADECGEAELKYFMA